MLEFAAARVTKMAQWQVTMALQTPGSSASPVLTPALVQTLASPVLASPVLASALQTPAPMTPAPTWQLWKGAIPKLHWEIFYTG